MSAVITVSSQDVSRSDITSVSHDVPLNAHLENLREMVCTMMTELECLGRLAPQESAPADLKDAVQQFEIDLITAALEKTRGNQSKAARLLGVKHTTLNAKLKRYHIRYPQPSEAGTLQRVAA